jgi:MerR family transcriptional regulator, heat shock protein HspR
LHQVDSGSVARPEIDGRLKGVSSRTTVDRVPAGPADADRFAQVPRHPIAYAARVTGLHPQTLRDYDRRGVIRVARTEGGKRLFSDAEIARATRVHALSDDGVPLSVAKRIVRLEDLLRTAVERIQVLEDQNGRLSARLQHRELTRR